MKVLLDLNVVLDVILNRKNGQLKKRATADQQHEVRSIVQLCDGSATELSITHSRRLTASRRRRRILLLSISISIAIRRRDLAQLGATVLLMRLRLRLAVKRCCWRVDDVGQWYVVQPAVLIPAKGETKLQVCFRLPSFSGFRST